MTRATASELGSEPCSETRRVRVAQEIKDNLRVCPLGAQAGDLAGELGEAGLVAVGQEQTAAQRSNHHRGRRSRRPGQPPSGRPDGLPPDRRVGVDPPEQGCPYPGRRHDGRQFGGERGQRLPGVAQ